MENDEAHLRGRLTAAALAALERGEELSLRAVARAAGVSAMAPYRHFADKAALREAVAKLGFERLREAVVAADAASDPRAALVAQGLAYCAFARAHPALFRLMFADHRGGPPAGKETAYDVMVRRVATLAPDAVEAGALACWATVHGLATLTLDGALPPQGSPQERAALTMMVAGIG